jgi:acetyl esterase
VSAGLHPQIRALVDTGPFASADTGPRDVEAERAAYRDLAVERGGPVEEVARVEDVLIPATGVAARAYWPREPADELGVVVWLHGGGWYVGDVEAFDRVTRQIANRSGAVCLSVEYRLAPEHRYPAAVEDARAAVAWATGPGARRLGADPSRVVVGGDSAGANLAVAAARTARERLRAHLLVYPALDPTMASASYREFADGPILTAATMAFCWRTYLDDRADSSDPDAAPLAADDLAGLPPAYVAVAGHDPLRDEGLRYVERLREAGVPVRLDRYDDMAHGFIRWGGVVDRARELIAALGGFAREAIAR